MTAWLNQSHRNLLTARNEIAEAPQPHGYGRNDATSEHSLQDYIDIFRRRKWIILLSFLITTSVVILGVLFTQPIYEAQALLLIEEHDPNILPIQEALNQNSSRRTEIELIQDRVTIEKVIDLLHLDTPRSQDSPQTDLDTIPLVTDVIASITQFFNTTIAPPLMDVISLIGR